MDSAVTLPASIIRLAEQLQRLSEVAEDLTYRLLELDERLTATEAVLEQRFGPDQSVEQATAIDQAERRLLDTEERLDRLETLLRQGSLPRAAVGQRPPLTVVQEQNATPIDAPLDEVAFLEEGEQPFMDELIA